MSSSSPSSSAAPTSSGVDPWSLSSQALRQQLLARVEAVLPQLFAMKLGKRRVKTVAFFVSQYWNDEADDAVHAELRYAFDVVTDPAALTRPEPYDDREHDDRMSFDDEFVDLMPNFDSNGEMIHAFASYACESSQDDLEYAPYCVWHQQPDGSFASTVIGTMLRPDWEDAVAPGQKQGDNLAGIVDHKGFWIAGLGIIASIVYWWLRG